MNTKLLLTPFFLAALALTAHAQLVTSTINGIARTTSFGPQTISAASGPVQDQASGSNNGDSALGQTHTSGISYISLAQHPGLTFIYTAPFISHAESQNTNSVPDMSSQAISTLRRDSHYLFDALTPGLDGTQGTIRATFGLSWDESLQNNAFNGGNATGLNVDLWLAGNTIDGTSQGLNGNGFSQSESGTALWTSIAIPIVFGNSVDLSWDMYAYANSAAAGLGAATDGSAQLWNLDVFDAGGHLLTRFSDYEWYEVSGTNTTSVASGAMAVPEPSCVALVGLGLLSLVLCWNTKRLLNN